VSLYLSLKTLQESRSPEVCALYTHNAFCVGIKLILRRVYLILRLTRAHLTNITTHAVQHAGDPSFRGKHSLLRLLLKFLFSKINVYFY